MSAEWLLSTDGEALTTVVSEVMSNVQAAVDQRTVQHRRGRPTIDIPEKQLDAGAPFHRS